jgi:HSP20 family protein
MTFVRYQPWGLVNSLHRQLDQVLGQTLSTETPSVSWLPRVDVYEESERFVVLADVPGVEPKDINITAEKDVLTIRGERHADKKVSENESARVERATGTFLRRFTLPKGADTESITARHTNGVLEVTIPKRAQAQPRRISVEAA